MKNMIKLTEIQLQEWNTFLGFRILRKKSMTGEIFIDPSKIVSFKEVTPKESINIHKNFPTYTKIKVIGREFSIDVVETPKEINNIIKQ